MSSVVEAKYGVVDSDDGRSSAVGREILKSGGNAVDAAVAVALVLGVINQGSSGIGGGAFMLVRMNDGRVQGFDMRETAPANAMETMYEKDPQKMWRGPLSIAVPGELKGLYEAWKMFGSKEWKTLVEPAIRYAEDGFTISPYAYTQMLHAADGIREDPGMRAIYTSDGYNLLKPGDICTNEKLAETLRAIADHGADEFYCGELAAKIVQDVARANGILTMHDMKNYRVKLREPISARVMDMDFLTMPPPASGGAGMILILRILEQYGPAAYCSNDFQQMHRFIEACKHMIAVRSHLGDPDFDPTKEVLADMLSEEFAGELKRTIRDDRTLDDVTKYGGKWHIPVEDDSAVVKDHGTSHMSIADKDRNVVALTSSVNWYFGSRFLSPSTGILLNDQMGDFQPPPRNRAPRQPIANRIKPHKRPLSSMAPTLVFKNGKLKAVVGSSGGFKITAGTAQVVLNHLAKKKDVMSSVMYPRIFHELCPNKILYEQWQTPKGYSFRVDERALQYLKERGHKLEPIRENNMCQLLILPADGERKDNCITAASDPRKGSYPAGY